MKVFPELSDKNSAPSGGFESCDPTVTQKKESVQKIVGDDSENLGFLSQSESTNL